MPTIIDEIDAHAEAEGPHYTDIHPDGCWYCGGPHLTDCCPSEERARFWDEEFPLEGSPHV